MPEVGQGLLVRSDQDLHPLALGEPVGRDLGHRGPVGEVGPGERGERRQAVPGGRRPELVPTPEA